jgi:hypothetical protein
LEAVEKGEGKWYRVYQTWHLEIEYVCRSN